MQFCRVIEKNTLRTSCLMMMSYHYLLFELDLTEIGQLGNGSICFLVKSKIKKMNPISFYYSHQQVIFFQKRKKKQQQNNKNAGRFWNIVSKDATYFVQ